ncbi:hypothetical protein KJ733_01035 [Patescibacteria group bacterium]|nr:hypothetical protein [Patescibacteria group bacterium]MBU1951480.1 hypothetical protein [Patescibacteria group bacterium]MBU2228827.1 hypothetical protein [Patescibacteria group bacterium]MBU2235840.1 hypothetical protein [Patescibacteria group bacterium]
MHNHDDNQNTDACLWGVELDSDYNSTDVRDAMLKCFVKANGDAIAKSGVMQLPEDENEKKKVIEQMTESFVKKAFEETGGDYNSPTKQSIMAALEKLKQYAAGQNHSQEMIEKHASEITKIADGLKE